MKVREISQLVSKPVLKPVLLICLICSGLVNSAVGADEPVTIESLLREMVDRDAVARYPVSTRETLS